jgi:hypothetical protein
MSLRRISHVVTQLPPPALVLCLAAACGTRPASEPADTSVAARSLPASTAAGEETRSEPPSRWVGAAIERRRLAVSVASTGSKPEPLAAEQPGSRDASLEVTDVAYDTRRELVYVGTCCEPASGHLWVLDTRAPGSGFRQGDQGFAVDVAGPASMTARTDTFGTLAVRASAAGRQELRADVGAADVAVDPLSEPRVVALVDTQRLRALVPTVTSRPPALMVMQPTPAGGWADRAYPLPPDAKGCRIVPLKDGVMGILAGTPDRANPVRCTGDRLDTYDPALERLRSGVVTFPARVRHLSIDESKTFLIFTTIEGAVGWRTLDGRQGSLAAEGFAAADW